MNSQGTGRGRTWTLIGMSIVAGVAIRLCYLVARYAYGDTAIKRPHIESGALLLAIVGLCFLLIRRSPAGRAPGGTLLVPRTMWIVMCCLALVLYWPALSVGFLSDDFVLVEQSLNWRMEALSAEFFRPVPLIVWGLVLHAGGGAVALHLLNILLHGTNAYLALCVAGAWIPHRWWMLMAALLVLTAPLAAEAVAWCSGVFDLSATALILTGILIARQYDRGPTPGKRLVFIGLGLGAVLSKESAVIGPALIMLDAWVRRSMSRKLVQDVLIAGGTIAVFSVVRLVSTFGVTTPAISRFRLQRVLFDSFGNLAVPWHMDVSRTLPLLTVFSGVSVICLLTAFVLASGERARTRTALLAALWILVSLVPLIPIFYVTPDLQGSRYLYLATFGWAVLVTTAAADLAAHRRWLGIIARGVVVLTIAAATYGVRLHLGPWTEAAHVRTAVEQAAALDTRMKACDVVNVRDLPDSVRGAYLFRVGAREVLAGVGVNAFVDDGSGPCSFRWDAVHSRFVQ